VAPRPLPPFTLSLLRFVPFSFARTTCSLAMRSFGPASQFYSLQHFPSHCQLFPAHHPLVPLCFFVLHALPGCSQSRVPSPIIIEQKMMCQREARCRLRSQSIRSSGPAFHSYIFGISSLRVHDPWRSILFSLQLCRAPFQRFSGN
jgi:hypothetical protein